MLRYQEVFYILFGQLMEKLWNKVRNFSWTAVKTAKWFLQWNPVDENLKNTTKQIEDAFLAYGNEVLNDDMKNNVEQVHEYMTSKDYQWEWVEAAVKDFAGKTEWDMAMAA